MKNLLLSAALTALLATAPAAAFAQQTVGDNSSGSQSGAASNANAQQATTVGPIDNSHGPIDSSVRVGDTTSDSTSVSGSIAGSSSFSEGGHSASDAHSNATGGTSSAVTGASSSTANNAASNAGNQQNITFNSTVPEKQTVKSVPQVYAPAMTTTLTETCMGSTSAGGSGVGFGITLGSTWNDKQCVRRLNAREMAQTLGDRDAARALLCQDEDVAKAYAAIGQSCTERTMVAVVSPPVPVPTSTPAPVEAPKPPTTMQPIPNPPEKGERGGGAVSEYDGERGASLAHPPVG